MVDYDCYPLWEYEDTELIDNPHPANFSLSEETVTRLMNWQKNYDKTMDWANPNAAGFPDREQEKAFEQEGISLWHQLRKELDKDYEIIYYSYELKRIVIDPNQVFTTQTAQ